MLQGASDAKTTKKRTRCLITGAAGFVGHHLVEYILQRTDWEIVTIDRFHRVGNLKLLADIDIWEQEKHRVRIVHHDIKNEINPALRRKLAGPFDYIVHLAGGSYVDRAIQDPLLFFEDNCIGTVNLLNYARQGGLKQKPRAQSAHGAQDFYGKFLFFSTDQVFGSAPEGVSYKEWDRHNPNNPYAASKSAAEMACMSFAHTYHMPISIVNVMNIFGERQQREKFIPLIIRKVLAGEEITIHGDKKRGRAGKRHYLHAANISAVSVWLLRHGKVLDGSGKQGRYNILGEVEIDNLALAKLIAQFVNEYLKEHGKKPKPLEYKLVDFHASHPGHNLRHALDGRLLKKRRIHLSCFVPEKFARHCPLDPRSSAMVVE